MMNRRRIGNYLFLLLTVLALALGPASGVSPALAGFQTDIPGDAGSGAFGIVTVLPNGNFVVIDTTYDAGAIADVGAVYLYNGATGAQISKLTGSSLNDQVGNGGITVLSNGNYVVVSSNWDNGVAADAGAATWGSGTSGVSGAVSAANSLVGSSADDWVGRYGIIALGNGNYVVDSRFWDNGVVVDAGAVTWGSGVTGVSGAVSAAKSLVGSTPSDLVGSDGVFALTNGNYVAGSRYWDNGTVADAGAVTWGNGATGVSGAVTATNSLVGSTPNDNVGNIYALSNGNYVVASSFWDNGAVPDAGAVTWGSGTSGATGVISAANSLVGSTDGDRVGSYGALALSSGNYVVTSPIWDNGAAANAGAVTWGSGTNGVSGAVAAGNSLVGTTAADLIGSRGVNQLTNGNYVIASPEWDNGVITNVGAVTWGSGTVGVKGAVSATNSLVGSKANDFAGFGTVSELNNGNFVVSSPFWDNGVVVNAGAATWGSGVSGLTGEISVTNSLVGSTLNDQVGDSGIFILSNGHYLVFSTIWDNGVVVDAGAVTWGSGTLGVTGAVSAANSLVGSTDGDRIGGEAVALSNGNYVVPSTGWDNGAVVDAGAVTWGSGTSGVSGAVSAANSLVGSTTSDEVGSAVKPLSNDNYVVLTDFWDNGAAVDVGAVTWGSGTSGVSGAVSAANSLVGSTTGDLDGSELIMLSNGNFVVSSSNWDRGVVVDAGAVTWGSGTLGATGAISETNSLVGSSTGDQVGLNGVTALNNGGYVVASTLWDNGASADTGAISLGIVSTCSGPLVGPISADNSVLGSTAGGGVFMNYAINDFNHTLVVGRPGDNKVSLLSQLPCRIFLPLVVR